jgi:small subunit ribosomal protein S8
LVFAGFVLESWLIRVKFPELERQVGNMTNYSIGDFLIRLKNAAMGQKREFKVPRTNLIENLAKLLKKEGYISEINKDEDGLLLSLSFQRKEPVLMDIKLVSKPGLRVYKSIDELKKYRGPASLILSTPKGLMMLSGALKNNVGGEVLAEII